MVAVCYKQKVLFEVPGTDLKWNLEKSKSDLFRAYEHVRD